MAMPSVMDAPELVEYVETHDFAIEETLEREPPQPYRARPGFWRTLAQKITTHLTPGPWHRHPPEGSAYRSFEPPWTGWHGRTHASLPMPLLSSAHAAPSAHLHEYRRLCPGLLEGLCPMMHCLASRTRC